MKSWFSLSALFFFFIVQEDEIVLYRRSLFALLAMLGFVVASSGADPVPGATTLKWKFEKDKTFYQEMSTDTTQTIKISGTDVKNVQKQTFWFSWKPSE